MTSGKAPILRRLLARLVAAIDGIVGTLIPVIQTIENSPTRPWQQRTTLAARFWTIVRELLALTARVGPNTLAENPTVPSPLPLREGPGVGTRQQRITPSKTTKHQASPLTTRQLAKRLAALLQQLHDLAIEAATTLPARIRHYAAQARTIAGCDPLSTPNGWERTG